MMLCRLIDFDEFVLGTLEFIQSHKDNMNAEENGGKGGSSDVEMMLPMEYGGDDEVSELDM
jgi:hypothetical protein